MTRIDSNTVGAAINVQPQDESLGARRVGKQQETPMEIGLGAHLKAGTTAPVPEFASSTDIANVQAGGQALPIIFDNIGVDYAAILGLVYKLSSEERKASSDATVTDILSVADKTKEAADDLRSGATLAFAGGIASGTLSIASGVASIGGAATNLKLTTQAKGMMAEGNEATTEMQPEETVAPAQVTAEGESPEGIQTEKTEVEMTAQDAGETEMDISEMETKAKTHSPDTDMKSSLDAYSNQNKIFMLSQRANSISMATQGTAGALQGTGSMLAAAGKFGSDQYEAQSKDDEAIAQQRRAAMEKEQEYGKSMADDTRKIMDIYNQMEQSQHETMTKIMDTI